MIKTVAGKVLRYGAVYCVFGVFGVLIVMLPWFKHASSHDDAVPEDGDIDSGNASI